MTHILHDSAAAAQLLRQGELVAFPTETVYGLGAPIFCVSMIEKIFRVKGRQADNPLIAHISDLPQIGQIARDLPADFFRLAEVFFPGPLTIVLKKRAEVPLIASGGLETIGVRMPAHPLARELIRLMGEPLVAPSANLSGKPSSTRVEHVLADFAGKIGGVLVGECLYGLESTVLLLEPQPVIVRPGQITQEQLEVVLGKKVALADGDVTRPLAPGMKYRHYAPQARVHVFETKSALLAYEQRAPICKRQVVLEVSPATLYHELRQADEQGCEEILILCEHVRSNCALMNRLAKASQ